MKIKIIKENYIENENMAIYEISCSRETITHHLVMSEYVGIIKLLDEKTLKPFVCVGMKVKCGDLLCKIEYLNIMIDIIADYSGIISKIYVENNMLVDYAKKIMVITS